MRGRGRDESVELGEDEARVAVYVLVDGEDGDAAVGDAEGGEDRSGHG